MNLQANIECGHVGWWGYMVAVPTIFGVFRCIYRYNRAVERRFQDLEDIIADTRRRLFQTEEVVLRTHNGVVVLD